MDAVSAAALVAGPRLLGWRRGLAGPIAAAGAAVAGYGLMTDYGRGGGPLALQEHLGLDALQGAGFCAAAALMRGERPEVRAALAGYGAFSIAAAMLTRMPGGRRGRVGRQVPVPRRAMRHGSAGRARAVAADIAYRRLGIVNVVFLGAPGAGDRDWLLVDAGLNGTAEMIAAAAAERFGDARPAAVVLTHGHFDHVGALEELAERWDAPIYAHRLEHPYLTGAVSYPPGDPGVGGGAMAAIARFYPTSPVNVGLWLRELPEDGSLPGAPAWRWLHTPGHSPGHVSLWRADDRSLVAGDAVITTRQESAYAVAAQAPEMHGPPAYFTTDWERAKKSARALAALAPELIVSGHGRPMAGEAMRAALRRLASEFDRVAVPHGARRAREIERSADDRG